MDTEVLKINALRIGIAEKTKKIIDKGNESITAMFPKGRKSITK